jgi:hypothetical protein
MPLDGSPGPKMRSLRVTGAKGAPHPGFVSPQLATLTDAAPHKGCPCPAGPNFAPLTGKDGERGGAYSLPVI